MTLLYTPEQRADVNPYTSIEHNVTSLVKDILQDESTLFLDQSTNPEMLSNQSIHFINGNDPRSDVARALEAQVLHTEWKQPVEETAEEMASIEQSSSFFVLIEDTPAGPKTIGALRIAEANSLIDLTETKNFFMRKYPDRVIPEGIDIQPGDNKLWDIVGVVTDSEHRDGKASNWLYHALYKKSCDLEVPYWISNVHDKEYRNLDMLGIPFRQVEGTEKVTVQLGDKVYKFGFYALRVSDIRPQMEFKISELEASQSFGTKWKIASMSRIAINGSTH